MTDDNAKKTNELEAEFRKLVIDELKAIGTKQEETMSIISDLNTEFKLHKQDSQSRWEAIAKLDEEQNEILSEHSARSRALQKQNELMEKALRADIFGEGIHNLEQRESTLIGRIEKLEEPKRFIQNLKRVFVALGAIAGALVTLYGFIKLIAPYIK